MNDIYTMDEPNIGLVFQAAPITLSLDEIIDTATGDRVSPGKITVKYFRGRSTPSDMYCYGTFPHFISSRFASLLREMGATGWHGIPVETIGKRGEVIPGYELLVIIGRCGMLDYSRGVERVLDKGGGKRIYTFGITFDPDEWDKSDIFLSPTTHYLFVTGRVKRAVEKAKLRGITFEPMSEMWHVDTPSRPFTG